MTSVYSNELVTLSPKFCQTTIPSRPMHPFRRPIEQEPQAVTSNPTELW